jgi:hypothetical protein
MAVSEVQVAKLALQHIGDRYDITSLNDASPEAEQVNLVFENARDAMFAEHPWKFCKSYISPARLSITTIPANWGYAFAYPADAMRVWKIEDPMGRNRPPIPFDIIRATVGGNNTKIIVCNESQPEFMYSAKITTATEWSPHFVLALSWRIAEMIAMPLTGSTDVKDRVQRDAKMEIGRAKDTDANEGIYHEQSRDPDWIEARK